MAGGVHATKSTIRPLVTASTVGTGNWLVSILEDIVAIIVSLLSILIAPLMMIFFILAVVWIVRFFWKRRQQKQKEYTYRG